MKRRWLPEWVSEYRDRHGKPRYRFRRKGFATYAFKAAPGTEAFRQEYAACLDGIAAPAVDPGADRALPGTFDDLIARYYRSPDFLDPGERTRVVYRGVLERWRQQKPSSGRRYGEALVRDLQARHVEKMMADMLPHRTSANMLRKRLKALMQFAIRQGLAKTNPVDATRPFKVEGGGFHTWSEAEITAYEATHQIGTMARLAFDLLLFTGQRGGDVRLLGPGHDRDNDHVTVLELRGFVADNLHGAFHEAQAIAQGTRCQQYLFSLSLNPPKGAEVGETEFERAADEAEKRLGLTGQPRAVILHEKEGRRHAHVVWSRIDAETRSGKGTTAIIPNLLTYGDEKSGSVLVLDPKGENALITASQRIAMGQEVHIVDPWDIASGGRTSRFNPLDWLDPADPDMTENAMILADALVFQYNEKDMFWTEEAKALLQGYILYVATDPRESDHRHLPRVRDLLLLDGDEMKLLWQRMLDSEHHIVVSTGVRCLQKEERVLANVIASAQAQTNFLDSSRLRHSLAASDFKFEDMKTKAMSIYLVLPADRLNAFGRWLRLLIQQAITVNARNIAVKPEKPILFILDEMPALGALSSVHQAYGLMAGFGMQLWGIAQDLGQLKKIYGEGGYESLISNSGCILYYGSRDKMTAEYFSSLCGVTTVWNLSSAVARAFSTSTGPNGGSSSNSTTTTDTSAASQRNLAYADELMRFKPHQQLAFIDAYNPIIGVKQPWFDNADLSAKGVNLHRK